MPPVLKWSKRVCILFSFSFIQRMHGRAVAPDLKVAPWPTRNHSRLLADQKRYPSLEQCLSWVAWTLCCMSVSVCWAEGNMPLEKCGHRAECGLLTPAETDGQQSVHATQDAALVMGLFWSASNREWMVQPSGLELQLGHGYTIWRRRRREYRLSLITSTQEAWP